MENNINIKRGKLIFDAPVTSIGKLAFYNSERLTSITIPNSVLSIEMYAFYDCPALTSITIPNSVTSIGILAFQSCPGLTSIVVEEGNTMYDSRENCNAIIETASNTLMAGCKNTIIPNSVTSIGDAAFNNCSGLTSITIPNNVTSIGNNVFYFCTRLTSITCEALTPPTLGSGNELSNVTAVYVPAESLEAYKIADNWSYYSNVIQPITES